MAIDERYDMIRANDIKIHLRFMMENNEKHTMQQKPDKGNGNKKKKLASP